MYDSKLDNRIEWTIGQITKAFPEYDVWADGGTYNKPSEKYRSLRKLFYENLTDKQIGLFRHWWHEWKVDGIDRTTEIKEMIDSNI